MKSATLKYMWKYSVGNKSNIENFCTFEKKIKWKLISTVHQNVQHLVWMRRWRRSWGLCTRSQEFTLLSYVPCSSTRPWYRNISKKWMWSEGKNWNNHGTEQEMLYFGYALASQILFYLSILLWLLIMNPLRFRTMVCTCISVCSLRYFQAKRKKVPFFFVPRANLRNQHETRARILLML